MKVMTWRERISIIAATQVMEYLEVEKVAEVAVEEEEDLVETSFIVAMDIIGPLITIH